MQEGTVPVPEGSASGLLGDAVLAAQLGGHLQLFHMGAPAQLPTAGWQTSEMEAGDPYFKEWPGTNNSCSGKASSNLRQQLPYLLCSELSSTQTSRKGLGWDNERDWDEITGRVRKLKWSEFFVNMVMGHRDCRVRWKLSQGGMSQVPLNCQQPAWFEFLPNSPFVTRCSWLTHMQPAPNLEGGTENSKLKAFFDQWSLGSSL